jgi:hypothetical protein
MVYLLMAACWLALGSILLAWWHWSDRMAVSPSIGATGIPLGWFAIAMALYNLLRWWLGHSSRKAARPGREDSPRRE